MVKRPSILRLIAQMLVLRATALMRRVFKGTPVQRWAWTNLLYRKLFTAVYSDQPIREVSFRGMTLAIPSDEITILPSLLDESYEVRELDVFEALCFPGAVVLDVGANVGIFSVLAGRAVGAEGLVVAFEPVPRNLELLRRNIEANHVVSEVSIVEAAVGTGSGELELFVQKHSVGTHSAAVKSDSSRTTVSMVSIDETIASEKLDRVDVLKIDIEGYEEFALRGAMRTIEIHRPTILIEFNEPLLRACGTNPRAVLDLLMPLYDFRYRIAGTSMHALQTVEEVLQERLLQNLVFSQQAVRGEV